MKYVLPELISQEIISGGTFFTGTYFSSHMLFPLSRPLGYINGIQLPKIELLIDRTSLIYLKVRLKALTSAILLIL